MIINVVFTHIRKKTKNYLKKNEKQDVFIFYKKIVKTRLIIK